MACQAEKLEESHPVVPATVEQPPVQLEYDFIEQPSQDFFCPVTLELLIEPHQTTCCGNHLSHDAASRLQRDGKPCPMCKEPQLSTIPDKYMKRRVNNVLVRCSYKGSGCVWEGEVCNLGNHLDSCPKRPWHCDYCDYHSTYDVGTSEHVPKCTMYPIVCPNSCEVGSVPRCDLEAHLMECPLQPVTCEYAEVGCDVKVPRRDLDRHMKEDQQQHLLSATLLNLRLTRENLTEKDRIIAEKDKIIAEKDRQIADLQQQLKAHQERLDKKMATLQQGIEKLDLKLVKSIPALHSYYTSQGYTCHDLVVEKYAETFVSENGLWESNPFYSHPGGYKCDLIILLRGDDDKGTNMLVWPRLLQSDNDANLAWPVELKFHILVINQLGDHDHHIASGCVRFDKCEYTFKIEGIPKLIGSSKLSYNAERNTQYIKDDCLKFQVYVKC